eukprot:scaffold69086_cov46-Phaeocystis_antarctica.AAC.2
MPSGAARAPGAARGRSPTGGRVPRRVREVAGWWRLGGLPWCWRIASPAPTARAVPPAESSRRHRLA